MIGWLHCVPDGQEGTPKSRAQMAEYPLPYCYPFNYLAEWFNELRMSYSYVDLDAWSKFTNTDISPVETRILMAMTTTYRGAMSKYKSKDWNNAPPHDGRTAKQVADLTAMNLKAFFKAN